MKPRLTSLLILTCFVAAAQMKDFEGYKDPALFTRMPRYFLSTKDSVVETPFDAYEFPVKSGTQRVEGRLSGVFANRAQLPGGREEDRRRDPVGQRPPDHRSHRQERAGDLGGGRSVQ